MGVSTESYYVPRGRVMSEDHIVATQASYRTAVPAKTVYGPMSPELEAGDADAARDAAICARAGDCDRAVQPLHGARETTAAQRELNTGRPHKKADPSATWPTFARRERKRKSAIPVGMTDGLRGALVDVEGGAGEDRVVAALFAELGSEAEIDFVGLALRG